MTLPPNTSASSGHGPAACMGGGASSRIFRPAATVAFTISNDDVYELVVDAASGRLDDVPAIAAILAEHTVPRP